MKRAVAAQAALLVIALAVVPLGSGAASAQDHDTTGQPNPIVLYSAPLQTQVVDPFRPPAHIGASGNRGLEYGSSDNQVVAAAADGLVAFAGPVAGRKVITIQHDDGIRTTYTGLLEIWVVEGMTVNRHAGIAIASSGFHFGARILDHYLDPQILIDASAVEFVPRLVPASASPG